MNMKTIGALCALAMLALTTVPAATAEEAAPTTPCVYASEWKDGIGGHYYTFGVGLSDGFYCDGNVDIVHQYIFVCYAQDSPELCAVVIPAMEALVKAVHEADLVLDDPLGRTPCVLVQHGTGDSYDVRMTMSDEPYCDGHQDPALRRSVECFALEPLCPVLAIVGDRAVLATALLDALA